MSVQARPLIPVPNAFAIASLPANRAASRSGRPSQRACSATVYIRSRNRRPPRLMIRENFDRSMTSTPHATPHVAVLACPDRLLRLPGRGLGEPTARALAVFGAYGASREAADSGTIGATAARRRHWSTSATS